MKRAKKRLLPSVQRLISCTNRAARARYRVGELVAQGDASAPMPDDLREWDRMPSVGLECEIQITEEDGVFIARCPNPEVCSEGATTKEALMNLREALELYWRP